MANTRTLQRSFSGGELSPSMFGRIDDTKYQSGAAKLRNFIPTTEGTAENRAGFAFVNVVKDSSKKTRLIPFTYSTTQTMVLEFGDGYVRFHTQGATLETGTVTAWLMSTAYAIGDLRSSGGVKYYCTTVHTSDTFATDLAAGKWYALTGDIYEVPTPYVEADLFDLHYVQSADILTFVHPNYAPRELKRFGAVFWRLDTTAFVPAVTTPTGVSISQEGSTSAKYIYKYCVTAVSSDGVSESAQSAVVSIGSNLNETGCTVTVSWSAVSGASRYNVYKYQGGIYGYIGQTSGTDIVDDNISPDTSKSPPYYDTVFNGTGEYPAAVSYFEQRKVFAGSINKPQNVWMTKSGTENDMSYSIPIQDDDRISIRVAARESNTIRHIVPLSQLLLLTSSAEWRVTSVNSDAITPTSISVKPQSYVGASNVQPAIVNNSLVYCAARGGHVRELGYNWQSSGFVTGDLSLRSAHLFDSYDITDMTYSKSPQPVLWFTSTSGKLLGLTYIPEQQIGSWHQHDTDGMFESCTCVAEGADDVLYVVVKRTIDGNTVRYVERMASRSFVNQEDAFFVDCGFTYDAEAINPSTGQPYGIADVISGLDALEGKTVSILADGAVHPQRVVTNGSITLDIEASVIQIGLPIQADLQTLPLALQIDGFGQGRMKNINKAWLRVYRSSGIFIGADVDHLVEAKQRKAENYGSPPALKSEEIQVMLTPSWTDSGQVYVRQNDPLPLTLVALTLEVSLGG